MTTRGPWWLLLVALVATTVAAGPAWGATQQVPPAPVAPTGTLMGVVTTTGTGEPVPGAWIAIMRAHDFELADEVVADADGAYSAEVGAGTYFLFLIDPTGGHVQGLWGAPDPVRITGGGVTTLDATMTRSTGSITGVVSDDTTGLPISGAWAVALNASGAPEAGATTDALGRFTLADLPTGRHRIAYLDPTGAHAAEFYDDAPHAGVSTPVQVTAGATVTADASLATQVPLLAFTPLRGTVTETGSGRVLPGVLVLAVRATDYRFAGATVTNDMGRYRFDLQPGTYKLAFLDPAGLHDMEWYDNRPFSGLATAEAVTAPSSNNDAALSRNTGEMQGTVVDQVTGAPIADAWVLAIGATGGIHGVVTDENGSYRATGLPVGTYRAAIIDTVGHRALRYWRDSADYAGADTFTVTGSVEASVDAMLSTPGPEAVLDSAVGWWDAAAGVRLDGSLPDLSGGGNHLTLHPGTVPSNGPVLLSPDPVRGRHLFSPGWDDMFLETPAPTRRLRAIDVAWEGDLARVLDLNQAATVDWLVHQGTTTNGTFSWAVGVEVATNRVVVARSEDGVEVQTTTTSAAIDPGPQRVAVTMDAVTGDLRLYQQPFDAPLDDFDADYSGWDLLDVVAGTGPLSLFESPAPIRHSSTVDMDRAGDVPMLGWFEALYRLRVRDDVEESEVAQLDIADIPATQEWFDLDGLPPVGDVTTAQATEFTGRSGEVWRITNYATTSYPIVIVERPVVVFGNGAYGEAPVSDRLFDLADDADLSVWCAYGFARLDTQNLPLVAHKAYGAVTPGYAITKVGSMFPGAPFAQIGDGTTVSGAIPPATTDGRFNISGFQVDRSAPYESGSADSADEPTLVAYTNGVPSAPTDLTTLGSLSAPGSALRVASWSDDGRPTAGFVFLGLAVFDRTLSQTEIDRLPYEFGLTPTPPD